ncbi:MAG: aminomethyl-transferring glycine dehydrogenase subunit GcvPA [bacterium]
MYNYLPHTDSVRSEMLQTTGLSSVDDLFANIPEAVKIDLNNKSKFPLKEGLSEMEAKKRLSELASRNLNTNKCISFLGGGVYNRYIPSCISAIVGRGEFLTSYTPYQPEVSQGTLQAMYEYQSMICNLTGMDVSNASVYDGASACAEAILMAARITKRSQILIPSTINPEYKAVIETYCYGEGIEVEYLPMKDGITDLVRLEEFISDIESNDYACILLQSPNYFGCIEEVAKISELAHKIKAKLILCADPVSMAILKSPADCGVDIVVGDVQSLGIPMAFGGPHGGFIACKEAYLRQIPGRIAGMTIDRDGERAFTLTLQAREQHIRRAKATSNICSNQALVALSASIYLAVMGPQGMQEIAEISIQKAHYLANKINEIQGFKLMFNNFLNEFIIKIDNSLPVKELISELENNKILTGINLEEKFDSFKNCLLVAVTEMNDTSDLYSLIGKLREISADYKLKD